MKVRRLTLHRAIWITLALFLLPWILQIGCVALLLAARRSGIAVWPVGDPVASVLLVMGMNVGITAVVVCILIVRITDYRVPLMGERSPSGFSDWVVPALIGLGLGGLFVAGLFLVYDAKEIALRIAGHPVTEIPWPVVAAFVGVTVIVMPILEEMVFRGVLFDALCRRWRVAIAVTVVTLVFCAVHVPRWYAVTAGHVLVSSPISVIVSGLILIWLRLRTKGIAASVVMHVSYNAVVVAAGVVAATLIGST